MVRKNILFCYSRLPQFTNTVRDYVHAFGEYSTHKIHYFDMDSGPLEFSIEEFDCIIFNYCFWGRCLEISKKLKEKISKFDGLKIAIFQDEYDYFLWHKNTVIEIGIQTIITCVPEPYWKDVFLGEQFRKIKFINALTGYVPDNLLNTSSVKPLIDRAWSIGYRSRIVPFHYGKLTHEKELIGKYVKKICEEKKIPINIEVSEESRFYGKEWPKFIGDCRTVLGTESGSNVFDFDGLIGKKIDLYINKNPDADFNDVHDLFLKEIDGNIKMNQISPRIFEAIAMRTGLILFEGEYSNVVKPWRHYIPLKKDFSNIDEVLDATNDLGFLENIIETAYQDVIASGKYHYREYIKIVDEHINDFILEGKGYIPMYKLAGWSEADSNDSNNNPVTNKFLPTDKPLSSKEIINDKVINIKIDLGAAYRNLMQSYKAILYSSIGKKIHYFLQKFPFIYFLFRKIIRVLTFRY
jgi:hypothetical protein